MEKTAMLSFESTGAEKILEEIGRLEKANMELRDEQKKTNAEIKSSGKVNTDQAKSLAHNKIQIQENSKAIREKTRLYAASVRQGKALDDSIKGISERLGLARAQYDRLSAEQRDNSSIGTELLKTIQDLDAEYKSLTEATGRHQASVGDYEKGTINLEAELTKLREEMVQLRFEGKAGTTQFEELRKKASQIQDAVDKTTEEINRFANDFKVVQDVVDTTNFMAQGFSLVQSSMALMGVESEDLEKNLNRLVAVGNIANNVNSLAGIIMKNNHVLIKTQTILTRIWGRAVIGVNGSLSVMKTLLSTLGIGLVIAAVALLVRHFDKVVNVGRKVLDFLMFWKDSNDDVIENTESYVDTLNNLHDASERLQNDLSKEIERMKARGKSIDDIKKKERELLEAQIEAANIRMELAFMESASLEKTAEEREAASNKFFEEMDKLDDLQHKLEIFDIQETNREREKTQNLQKEIDERNKIRQKEIDDEQKKLDDINARNELAEAELNYLLDDSLENRLKLEEVKHRQRIENTDMTHKELELAELEHQKKMAQIEKDAESGLLSPTTDEGTTDGTTDGTTEGKTEEEIEMENARNAFLNDLEQRRLAEMDYFDKRKELLDNWKEIGAITEQEYTSEISKNNLERIKSEKAAASQRALINMNMTGQLLGNLAQLAEGNEKMFVFQKRASQLEALINTYVGITQVLRDSTLPTYAKIAAVAMVLSTGLASVVKIQNQPRPDAPEFADGGVILGGRPHSQGGTPIYAGNQHVGTAESGEYLAVVNKKDATRASLLDSINRTHGRPLFSGNRFFRDGGSFDPRQDFNAELTEQVKEVVMQIANIPVVVSVRDINDGQEELREIETRGDLQK